MTERLPMSLFRERRVTNHAGTPPKFAPADGQYGNVNRLHLTTGLGLKDEPVIPFSGG